MSLPRKKRSVLVALAAAAAASCGPQVVAPTPRPVAPGVPVVVASVAGAPAAASQPGETRAASGPRAGVGPAAAPASQPATAAAARPGLRAYWVGHATVLVAIGDKWIITDPNFSDRVGLFARRKVTPGIDLGALPAVDWILVSHGHFDHLDKRSLARLAPSASVAIPPGLEKFIPKRRFREVVSLPAWQTVEKDGVRVTAVPVEHGDGRFGVDGAVRRGSHTGFIVEHQGVTLFFAGDTAYHDGYFKAIGRRFPRIDVALVPIGPVGIPGVRRMMRSRHADPADGLRILADVDARFMIPIHHGTFFTGGQRELDALDAAVRRSPVGSRVKLLKPGDAFTLPPGPGAPAPAAGAPVRAAAYQ
jgi:L-ascorbate metabolism protein UlaG (beta-lactamase superfamily)